MYRLRTRVTSPSRHCLQKMCWQVNTFGSVNFSRQIEHSRCSSKSSFEVVIIYISFWKKTFIHNTFIRHQKSFYVLVIEKQPKTLAFNAIAIRHGIPLTSSRLNVAFLGKHKQGACKLNNRTFSSAASRAKTKIKATWANLGDQNTATTQKTCLVCVSFGKYGPIESFFFCNEIFPWFHTIILLVIRIQDIRPLWKYGEELTRLLRSPMFSSLIFIIITSEGDAISFLREKKIPNWNNLATILLTERTKMTLGSILVLAERSPYFGPSGLTREKKDTVLERVDQWSVYVILI